MNSAFEYMVQCSDKGDFAKFLEKHSKSKKCIYHGDNDLDLHFRDGKMIKVTHYGIELKLVELQNS